MTLERPSDYFIASLDPQDNNVISKNIVIFLKNSIITAVVNMVFCISYLKVMDSLYYMEQSLKFTYFHSEVWYLELFKYISLKII